MVCTIDQNCVKGHATETKRVARRKGEGSMTCQHHSGPSLLRVAFLKTRTDGYQPEN